MMRLSILDKIKTHAQCTLTRDNRSVKVASGNSCCDYLQSIMWFDLSSPTLIIDDPTHSHLNEGIMLSDWLTNIVWSHYEDGDSTSFTALAGHLRNKTLFF